MTKRNLLLSISLLFFALIAYGQPITSANYETMIRVAEEKFQENDFYNSLEWYQKAYEEQKDTDTAYKIANLYRLLRDYEKAERWYSRVDSKDKKAQAYPDAKLMQAKMMKMSGNIDDAIILLQDIIAAEPNAEIKDKAHTELEGAKLAQTAKMQDRLKVKNIGSTINSGLNDYSAVYTAPDEMYYASYQANEAIVLDGKTKDYTAKIYSATRKDTTWGTPTVLGTEINRDGYHTSNVSFSKDGTRMFFTRSVINGNATLESKIYSTKRTGSQWGTVAEIANVNGSYLASHPAAGELFGNEVLFFTSNMAGGKGGTDLYYATLKADGTYSLPTNLGDVINTKGDEATPFYKDGKLYFSSNGLATMGGYDIFVSSWNGTNWSTPQNMGKGYNSTAEDMYFMLSPDGYDGFLVSNRPGTTHAKGKGETCCFDVYQFNIEQIKADLVATIFDQARKPISGAKVAIVEVLNSTNGKTTDKLNKEANNFGFPLELERQYMVITTKDGYYPDTIRYVTTKDLKKTTTIEKKITLRQIPPPKPPVEIEEEETIYANEPIRLNNIYYDFDDDKILPDAEGDLNVIIGLMNKYPDMVIELSSHTDARGNDAYNQKLSQRRANSAVKYMTDKGGIAANRMKPVGYGETVILNQCKNGVTCTDEEHRYNRRTEFKIIAGPTEIKIPKSVRKIKKVVTPNR